MYTEFNLLSAQLLQHAHEDNAAAMKAYMKDNFEFYGIKSPLRKELQKPFIRETKQLNHKYLIDSVTLCWQLKQREYQYIAMDVLKSNQKKLDIDDIPFVEKLITKKSWWDSVDFLATTIIGGLLKKYPETKQDYIEKWIHSGNMWLERTAILHQLKYAQQTDKDLLAALIDIKKEDKEFFIQKAIGWSLRQYSKYNPLAVTEILESYPELSGLAKREGSKYL